MISGQNVDLVCFEQQHLANSRKWFNDPELARLLDRIQPVSEDQHQVWFQSLPQREDLLYFAVECQVDRQHVGNIWLADIDSRNRKAELRIVIGESAAVSRGLGSESMSLLCEHAFTELNLHRIYAYVLDTNPRAKRAFEKAGFQIEGTLRDDRCTGDHYVDVHLLARVSAVTDGGAVPSPQTEACSVRQRVVG